MAAQVQSEAANDGKRTRRSPWNVVLVVSLIVLVASLAALGAIWFSYYQGQQKYDAIAEHVDVSADDKKGGFTVDWDALLAANPETVAWLYVPGTAINYPVVHGSDNDYYLTHDFDGDQGWLANFGAIFMDYRNNPDWSDRAYFIYGHHMNDGSMFADIAAMGDQGFFDSCRTVYLLSPRGNFTLRTFSLVHCSGDDPLVQNAFSSEEDMAAYVQDKIDRSIVDPGVIPAASDIKQVFAFATCDNGSSDGRYVLFAYVQATTVEGLSGKLGLVLEDGETAGFADEITVEQ